MSRYMWIIAVLILVMVGSQMYLSSTGGAPQRSWDQCKESFVQQLISDQCTPRRGIQVEPGSQQPAPTATGPEQPTDSTGGGRLIMQPAPDDGIDRVDRGG